MGLPTGQISRVRHGTQALQLAFVVGPRRVWPNLWKATNCSLGAILGRDDGAREWNARDGCITDLGLHRTVDPTVGDNVTIAIRASTVEDGAAEATSQTRPSRSGHDGAQPRWLAAQWLALSTEDWVATVVLSFA